MVSCIALQAKGSRTAKLGSDQTSRSHEAILSKLSQRSTPSLSSRTL